MTKPISMIVSEEVQKGRNLSLNEFELLQNLDFSLVF